MSIGCNYVTHATKKWNRKTKRFDDVPVHCNKLKAENEELCPKHKLFKEDEEKEEKRKEEAKILNKEMRKKEEEELAASPLAAINPEFKEKKAANWMRGYGI
jgi:hypothetical protein